MIKRQKHNEDDTEDKELIFFTKLLRDIHKEYYASSDKDIRNILDSRKNIFSGLSFYIIDEKLRKRIEAYGGVVRECIRESNYILGNRNNMEEDIIEEAKEMKSVIIDEEYIHESIYKLRRMCVDKYIIYDFSEDDEIINDLFEDT